MAVGSVGKSIVTSVEGQAGQVSRLRIAGFNNFSELWGVGGCSKLSRTWP